MFRKKPHSCVNRSEFGTVADSVMQEVRPDILWLCNLYSYVLHLRPVLLPQTRPFSFTLKQHFVFESLQKARLSDYAQHGFKERPNKLHSSYTIQLPSPIGLISKWRFCTAVPLQNICGGSLGQQDLLYCACSQWCLCPMKRQWVCSREEYCLEIFLGPWSLIS